MGTEDGRIRVLFVCLGNICRSPMAEGVFREVVRRAGLADRFEVDSAGTSSWHTGEPPDERASAVAVRRGVELTSRARQVAASDLATFDYVLAMDAENLARLRPLEAAAKGAEVQLLRAFDAQGGSEAEVPDPYFGGPGGFDDVYEMIERACRGLLAHIRKERGI